MRVCIAVEEKTLKVSPQLQTTKEAIPTTLVFKVITAMPIKHTEWKAEQLKDHLYMNVEVKFDNGEDITIAFKSDLLID